jgi:hypothetical protein
MNPDVFLKRNFAILIVCSCLVAVLLGHWVSDRAFYGSDLRRVVTGDLSSDSWVGSKATVAIPGFWGGFNSIELQVGLDRPGASEAPKVAVALCGGAEQELTLAGSEFVSFATPFSCSPLTLTLRPLNFFSPPGERAERSLGVQIKSISVGSPLRFSRFKLAVASPELLIALCGLLVALVGLVWFVAERAGVPGLPAAWAALAAVIVSVFLMRSSPDKLEPVAMVVLGALTGMALYVRANPPRAASAESRSLGLVWLALPLGAALRLYGIRFGLPANFHPDEVPKVNAIMRMVDGKTLDPQYFLHPSLLLYLTYGMNKVLHFFGVAGSFRDTAFLAGRLVSASAGVASIALTYLIGKRLFSRETGGVAAILLAVFPLHVTCSRYLKEDALLTFVVLSCVLVTIVSVQTHRRPLLLVAGLLAGCTAGTKYSGILMAVMPASAPWIASRSIKPDRTWLLWACAAVLIAPLGFLATTPYSIINSAKFLNDFRAESQHMQNGHTVTITAWSQLWMYHFWRSIMPGVGWCVAAVGCVAFGFLLRRGRLEDLIVISVALLFYLPAEYVKAKPAPQPERYILPCLPFLALGVAELLRTLSGYRQQALRAVLPVCTIILVGLPFLKSVQLAGEITNDTRDQLAVWMKEHLPKGSKVLMDWKPYCPNFHGEHFEVEHIPRAHIIQELDVAALRRSGADYLVVSSLFYNRYFSQPESEPVLRQRFREVFQRVPVITQFFAPSGSYGFHNPTLTLFSLSEEDFQRLEQERNRKNRGEIDFTSNEVRARAKW